MKTKGLLFLFLVCLLSVMNIMAGEVGIIEDEITEDVVRKQGMGQVALHSEMVDWAALDGSGGDVRYSGFGVQVNLLFFNLGYAQKHFEWKHVEDLPFGDGQTDLWDELYQMNLGLGYDVASVPRGTFDVAWRF